MITAIVKPNTTSAPLEFALSIVTSEPNYAFSNAPPQADPNTLFINRKPRRAEAVNVLFCLGDQGTDIEMWWPSAKTTQRFTRHWNLNNAYDLKNMSPSSPVANLGYNSRTNTGFFGYLDELRFWANVTVTNVRSYQTQTLTGYESGLLHYWNFDDRTISDKALTGLAPTATPTPLGGMNYTTQCLFSLTAANLNVPLKSTITFSIGNLGGDERMTSVTYTDLKCDASDVSSLLGDLANNAVSISANNTGE